VRAAEAMDEGPAHRSAAIPGLSSAAAFTYVSLLDAGMANKGRATQLLVLGNKIDAAFSQDRTARTWTRP
jgi:hypothetical protein